MVELISSPAQSTLHPEVKMPIATGYITIADIQDGLAGVNAVLSNENHTFVAAADGSIADAELAMYGTTISAFIGTMALQYEATTTPALNMRYSIYDGVNTPGSASISINPCLLYTSPSPRDS